ncbi:uncharacterized protein LOC134649887 [Cydia amplana]|uniref:uncharacterized protein LOC134649887 n=1 Tax=Cydia amplana TaxID=1869771 RepID=UPI002FE55FA7
MDSSNLASGDNNISQHIPSKINEANKQDAKEVEAQVIQTDQGSASQVDDETKIKERIAQCRSIIESLKFELSEEKSKLEMENKITHSPVVEDTKSAYSYTHDGVSTSQSLQESFKDSSNPYVTCVDAKLNYDENLIEYEKQLQKYQTTLNMAQMEKKNAIRKQMLAKAFKLKLLEVENQCNIELLRVKQSLQCLEPLKMIVNQWKNTVEDNTYDANNFILMPRYPELKATSGSDVNSTKGDNENVFDKSECPLNMIT